MTLYSAAVSTIEISKVMLPPVFVGFFVASFIRSSPGFSKLSMPTSRLASISNLPQDCSAALALFLVNSWSGLAALSGARTNGSIDDRELIVAVLVSFIPKGLNNLILFSIPVAVSVLGPFLGGIYVLLDLSASIAVAISGMIIGNVLLKPREFTGHPEKIPATKALSERIRSGLRDTASSSVKMTKVLVPTIFLAQVMIEYLLRLPVVEEYNSLVAPLGLTSSSIIVLLASTVSQSAALAASETLVNSGSISGKGCIILLFIARFLHLGIGCIRVGLPANVSYFGFALGLRATVVEYSLIEIANAAIILFLYTGFPYSLDW